MPRTGVEDKPAWRAVPAAVRASVDALCGSPVVRGARVWGGYAPTPTFQLLLADGRRVFLKGTSPTSNATMVRALDSEQRVYTELGALISPFAPRYLGALRESGWHVLLLEDAGPATIPPWSAESGRRVAHACAEFHASTLASDLPAWLDLPERWVAPITWSRVERDSGHLRKVAALAGPRAAEAHRWLGEALPTLQQYGDHAAEVTGPFALLHGDIRSDNLRYRDGRLYLFDWPWANAGRPEFDVVPFAQSVAVDGGPNPERVLEWYEERLALRPDAVDAALAWIAAFFAQHAWEPEVPGLPRLRAFQRRQLAVVLAWAARRFGLPYPGWVAELG